jgi:hypothetical protein
LSGSAGFSRPIHTRATAHGAPESRGTLKDPVSKFVSPLLGYNNNVRHKGKVFHIQTEDSGVKYGHIITHLFMDGGRILKSVKTSYSEYLGSDRMADIVREMMKQQHKAMFIALRDGKFDIVVDGSTEAMPLAEPEGPSASPAAAEAKGGAAQILGAANAAATVPPGLSAFSDPDGPATIRTQMPEELMLDIDALERAAAAASGGDSPLLRGASDLPPPPANLFRERKGGTGKYKVTPPPATVTVEPAGKAGSAAGRPSASLSAAAPVRRASQASLGASTAASDRRYAPTRPASIFGQAKPAQGKTIFGEDLISDKSLDEVILSYLAEDLDEKK